MKSSQLKMAFGAAMILGLAPTGSIAQTAEPTFKGDPSVYKVIFEDANFRVIEARRSKHPASQTIGKSCNITLLLQGHLAQYAACHIIDKTTYRNRIRHPGMGFHLLDLLAYVLFQIAEGVEVGWGYCSGMAGPL